MPWHARLARGPARDLGRRSQRGGATRAAVAEGRGRADRWGQAVSGGDARVGACVGVNGDTRVGRGAWAERAIWACWAAAVGEELGPRGV